MSDLNISDISASSKNQGGASLLPIRTEKTVMVSPNAAYPSAADFDIVASRKALKQYTDYISIRMRGRGGSVPGVFDPTNYVSYRFLINPSEVRVQRQTIDEQSLARGGWQVGVWGEDFAMITLNGKTPGKYFAHGLTDPNTPLTKSYRNALALELVVENNGYWFEGEEMGSSLLKTASTRRIKMHQDVELTVADFIWDGMFESMELVEDANSPYLEDFTLVFISWRERFFSFSPYPNSLGPQLERGHYPRVTSTTVSATAAPPVETTSPTINYLIQPEGYWTLPV